MSIYVPEIVEEVSEDAKFLMEDNGKIVRVGDHPKGGNSASELEKVIVKMFNNRPLAITIRNKEYEVINIDGDNYIRITAETAHELMGKIFVAEYQLYNSNNIHTNSEIMLMYSAGNFDINNYDNVSLTLYTMMDEMIYAVCE